MPRLHLRPFGEDLLPNGERTILLSDRHCVRLYWSRDDKRLFYNDRQPGEIRAIPIGDKGHPAVEEPELIVKVYDWPSWDVGPEDEVVYVPAQEDERASQIEIILNWEAGLKAPKNEGR